MCAQRRLRSTCAFAHSKQNLSHPSEKLSNDWLPTERKAMTQISLRICAGWSESLLGGHAILWRIQRGLRGSTEPLFDSKFSSLWGHGSIWNIVDRAVILNSSKRAFVCQWSRYTCVIRICNACLKFNFIISDETSVFLMKIKVVSITSEMIIPYHFTNDWYDLYFHSSLWMTSVFFIVSRADVAATSDLWTGLTSLFLN